MVSTNVSAAANSNCPKMRNDRRAPRRRTLKSGIIILGRNAQLSCVVRDLSESGARLEIQGTYAIPLAFQFAMTGLPQRTCKMVWRTDREIGVEFQPKQS
jgi:hypothetical protein